MKPKRLNGGDRVAIVSPSWGGAAMFPARYQIGKQELAKLCDLDVCDMPHTCRDPDWIKRNPAARAEDLMTAFADPRIAAIVTAIGGDDSIRLLPYLDLSVITENPKIFLGYSDATTIHFACMKAGLGTFYGPSILSGFAENGGPFDYMLASVRRTLLVAAPIGEIEPHRLGWTAEPTDWANSTSHHIKRRLMPASGPRLLRGHGKVRGNLIGGCAETLESLKGTSWWSPLEIWRNAILFYETSEDMPAPALVQRWLKDFAQRGILQVLSGIIFGRPGGTMSVERHLDYDRAILTALDEAGLTDLPVLAGLDFGHTDPFFTLPYGRLAEIDCDKRTLAILESAVL